MVAVRRKKEEFNFFLNTLGFSTPKEGAINFLVLIYCPPLGCGLVGLVWYGAYRGLPPSLDLRSEGGAAFLTTTPTSTRPDLHPGPASDQIRM